MRVIDDVRAKLERARKHTNDLNTELAAFIALEPYHVATKRHPETKQLIYFLSRVAETPTTIALICGEILQSLRSTLDHVANHLVRANNRSPTKQTSFPISDDAPKYKNEKGKKVDGMSAASIAEIDAIKPYRGGNDALWRLHKLNNIDKHRTLVAVGSAFRSFDVGAVASRMMREQRVAMGWSPTPVAHVFLRPADPMFPLAAGKELFRDLPHAEPTDGMGFQFDVTLQEPEADLTHSEPIAETLAAIAKEVEATIGRLEVLL